MTHAMRIDSHQHFWRIADREGRWPPPTLAPIHRDFEPPNLLPALNAWKRPCPMVFRSASAITERAMCGEIDFAGALRDRVALLAGLAESTVAECLRERVKLMGGAIDLIGSFRAAGGRAILVSGGFTHFSDSIANVLGFDCAVANRLVVKDGMLTGEVERPIVDAQTKRETLLAQAAALGIPLRATIAIGDGANDIPMIKAAGLGVAYHAKTKTQDAADASVRYGDLSVIRYALG